MEINLKNNFLIGDCIHGIMIWPMGDGVLTLLKKLWRMV